MPFLCCGNNSAVVEDTTATTAPHKDNEIQTGITTTTTTSSKGSEQALGVSVSTPPPVPVKPEPTQPSNDDNNNRNNKVEEAKEQQQSKQSTPDVVVAAPVAVQQQLPPPTPQPTPEPVVVVPVVAVTPKTTATTTTIKKSFITSILGDTITRCCGTSNEEKCDTEKTLHSNALVGILYYPSIVVGTSACTITNTNTSNLDEMIQKITLFATGYETKTFDIVVIMGGDSDDDNNNSDITTTTTMVTNKTTGQLHQKHRLEYQDVLLSLVPNTWFVGEIPVPAVSSAPSSMKQTRCMIEDEWIQKLGISSTDIITNGTNQPFFIIVNPEHGKIITTNAYTSIMDLPTGDNDNDAEVASQITNDTYDKKASQLFELWIKDLSYEQHVVREVEVSIDV